MRKLVCGHTFHHDCIKLWIVRKNNCPNCKINPFTGEYADANAVNDNERLIDQRNLPWFVAQRAFAQAGF